VNQAPLLGDPNSFINKWADPNYDPRYDALNQPKGPSLWDRFGDILKNLPIPSLSIPTGPDVPPFTLNYPDAPPLIPDWGKVSDVVGASVGRNLSNQRGLGLRERNPYKSGLTTTGF
jgi:hypothetical protein